MTRFYQPDLSQDINSPFIRDGADKLIRRSYWLDMDDRTLVMVMVNGIGANLTNDEKGGIWQTCDESIYLTRFVFRKYCRLKSDGRRTIRCA